MKVMNSFKKGMAVALSAALMLGLVPVMPGSALKVQAAGETSGADTALSEVSLGTGVIANPTAPTDANSEWKGSYVYFGTDGYDDDGNFKPVKYRVLDNNTTIYGGTTMLLDCDSILTVYKFDNDGNANDGYTNANEWAGSDARTYLNGGFCNYLFSTVEADAIAESTKDVCSENDGNGWNELDFAPLNGDKIFLLDAKEATNTSYGYFNTNSKAVSRKKTGFNMFWWTRSAKMNAGKQAGVVGKDGSLGDREVNNSKDKVGISPAFNIDLSSILFSSVISGTAGEEGTEYKLTLIDKSTIIATNGDITRNGDTITVPYTITEGNGGSVSKVSVLILDREYTAGNTNDAKILAYDTIKTNTVNFSTTGTGTFTLPADLSSKECGKDYYVYIIAEHVSEDKLTNYASTPLPITVPASIISPVAITDIDAPTANTTLDTSASCTTTGVSSTTPQVTWLPVDSTAGYNTSYTASVTLTADAGYKFADSTTATVNDNPATNVTKNADGTLTVTYTFPATAKDKLTSITAPQGICVANGTAYASMNLPTEVNIVTAGRTATTAAVSWDTTTPASGSYDPDVLTEQTVTLNGTVTCPEEIDANGVALTTTITITIEAAGITGAPTANPTAGTYTQNQSVTLTSSTEGATIYYTTDGSEPTLTGGVPGGTTQAYTAPIAVTGTEGQSITTVIKAMAVKSGMQDSSVETFTYTIQLPVSKYDVTVINGSGSGQYAQGETVTIIASAAPSGQQFKEWEIVSGNIALASSTSETTSFTMQAEEVSVKAIYEAVPVTEYSITATAGANGTISPSGAVKVTAGGSQTFTISPSSGYVIDTLKVDGLEVTAATSYTFSDVNTNHTIEVKFKQESQTPNPVDYDILDGANSSWTQNSDGSLSIRGSGAFSKFVGVKVDGTLVDAKNYTVKEGSTIVTLKTDYLNTISVGTHTFEILWTDGSASTTFTVVKNTSDSKDNDTPAQTTDAKKDNQNVTAPETGDDTSVVWMFILFIFSGTGLIITAKKRRINLDSSER